MVDTWSVSALDRTGHEQPPVPAQRTRPGSRTVIEPPAHPPVSSQAGALDRAWLRTLQRSAGNHAVAGMLGARPAVQRESPVAPAPAPAEPGTATPAGGSREPTKQERDEWGSYFDGADFRMVRDPVGGFNCFAWAVGVTDRMITSDTLMRSGYRADLDGWTKYLADTYKFAVVGDGLDPAADLILYGSPTTIWHAARRADAPVDRLTFTSKLGDGKTPVILHAPGDIQGRSYGQAQRSFRRG